jgi:hypothetical protein
MDDEGETCTPVEFDEKDTITNLRYLDTVNVAGGVTG